MKKFDFSYRDYRTMLNTSTNPDDYFRCSSYTTIDILQFLWGRHWDEISLSYVLAMNPSSLRVTCGDVSLDGYTNRITIFVDKQNRIIKIIKEIQIGLPDGIKNGAEISYIVKDSSDD